MSRDAHEETGRYLAYVLRHRPEEAGVDLVPGGWVAIDELLRGCAAAGHPIDRRHLDAAVASDAKGRFEVDGDRVRAAQGHSVEVDLALAPATPPAELFHGTVERFLTSIDERGLRPGDRRFVHLSADLATAVAVGSRRGEPVVLVVDALGLHETGAVFHQASNGVWLTAAVAPRWIRRHDPPRT